MDIPGLKGELRATIHVRRAATGKTETFEIVGHSDSEKLKELMAEPRRSKVHGTCGAVVGPDSILTL